MYSDDTGSVQAKISRLSEEIERKERNLAVTAEHNVKLNADWLIAIKEKDEVKSCFAKHCCIKQGV